MTMNDIAAMLGELNVFVAYGAAVVLTGLVAIYRAHPDDVPRPLALFSWYMVMAMAGAWLLFHVLFYFTYDPRDTGLVAILRGMSFLPVYICAAIAACIYPRRGR